MDTDPLVPATQAYFWHVIATSIIFAYFKSNKALEQQGVYHDALYKGIGTYFPVLVIVINFIQIGVTVLLAFKYGILPVLYSLIVIAIGMFPASLLFGFMPLAQYIMPIASIACYVLLAQVLGWINFPILAAISGWVMSLVGLA